MNEQVYVKFVKLKLKIKNETEIITHILIPKKEKVSDEIKIISKKIKLKDI